MMKNNESELSERDCLLIQAYFDGELDSVAQVELENRIRSGDPLVLKELERLRCVRTEIRGWISDSVSASSETLNIWSAIKDEIYPTPEPFAKVHGWKKFFERILPAAKSNVFWEPRQLFQPQLAGGALMILFIGIFIGNSIRTGVDLGETPSPTLAFNSVSNEISSRETLERNVPLEMSEPTRVAYHDRFSRFLRQREPLEDPRSQRTARLLAVRNSLPRLLQPNFVSGGMRTAQADIDWIRTPSPFRLVSASGRSEPPTIWVAK